MRNTMSNSTNLFMHLQEFNKMLNDEWWREKMTWDDENGNSFVSGSIPGIWEVSDFETIKNYYLKRGYNVKEFQNVITPEQCYRNSQKYLQFRLYQIKCPH